MWNGFKGWSFKMEFKSEYCAELLLENGFLAYYAFETARDMLLRSKPRVIKILTNADLSQLSKLFPEILFRRKSSEHAYLENGGYNVQFYVSDCLVNPIGHVPGIYESKKQALKKATSYTLFLINGFFYDIKEDIFFDPLDAYSSLKKGIIQTKYQPEIVAEYFPLLALKTAKVYSETGFAIDGYLYTFINEYASLRPYKNINEDIAQDFLNICLSGRAFDGFFFLNECGVLDLILPEVTALKEVYQDKDHHPEGNGFWHTLQCLKWVKRPNKNLMMAILLHDTGKAITKRSLKSSLSFPNHSSASKVIAKKVLNRFYFKKEDIEEVLFLVENHMILNAIDRLPESRLKLVFNSPYFSNLLELYRADLSSSYHDPQGYYHASRIYREYMRREKLMYQGV